MKYDLHCKANLDNMYTPTSTQTRLTGCKTTLFLAFIWEQHKNIQGTVKELNINTGKVKKPKQITEVPMPDSFVKIVND